ncbi:MAG: hypothetical protein WCE69_16000 [Aestuariivirga sp.]
MKTMKVALLATAALAAVSVSARADDTAAIKAQLEALTARIAQLEAAPAAPMGYSLLTISEGTATAVPGLEETDPTYGDKATVIGVMPTADVPASASIEWSGYVRAAIVNYNYKNESTKDDSTDVITRGQLKVVGKTDTAVGEVGVKVGLRAEGSTLDTKPTFVSNEYWGWWAMTPEITFGGGYSGSLGNIGYGYDGACNCYITDSAEVSLNPGDAHQLRLSWASGPMSAAVAVEDATGEKRFGSDADSIGVAGEVKYSGDVFSGEISGVYHDNGGSSFHTDSWQAGAGLGFSLGDMASLSIGGAMGQVSDGQDFWSASALLSANLSDTIHAEISYGVKEYDEHVKPLPVIGPVGFDNTGILAGIYYEPVSQLTLGLEGEYRKTDDVFRHATTLDFVTVWRF